MSESNKMYIYHCSEKIEQAKKLDQITFRTLPKNRDDSAIVASEQFSSAPTWIDVSDVLVLNPIT